MLQHLGVIGQVGMDHQRQIGQVDAARRHIGGDADPGASVAQRLQRVVAFALAEFARQRHGGKAALQQHGFQMAHRLAGVAEDQRAGRIDEAQQIDHRALDPVLGDADGAIFDIGMAAGLAARCDAKGVALVMLARVTIALGRVAENSRVRRSAGVVSRMNCRSSRKPRSSISSASSSTTALQAGTFSARRSR